MSAKKMVQVALNEVGYIEKRTNSQLDSKTANAGSNNYTKYGAWIGCNGQPWCNSFVAWTAYQAGESEAVGKFTYVPYQKQFFQKQGRYHYKSGYTPVPGDIIIFRDESHVGIVEYVSGGYVHTIEGNTSGGSSLVANGGGVFQKCYPLSSSYIEGYGHPAYSGSSSTSTNTNHGTSTSTNSNKEDYETVKTYRNGSTPETVYSDTSKKVKIGSLNPYETCDCLGKVNGMYIVRYKIDGTNHYKVGVVAYSGGVK